MVLRLRGVVLPDEVTRDVFVADGVLRFDPVPDAETVVEDAWILPGLVDVHTHPGADRPGDPFDETVFRADVEAHRDAGVLALRFPGLAARVPDRLREGSVPTMVSGGRWLCPPGGFFPGWGREVDLADLPATAVEEAQAGDGWCKVVADWRSDSFRAPWYGPTVPPDTLAEVVTRVHDVGGRVAVHTQHPDGSRAAVDAGADSIEHGTHLDPDLLDRMAADGIALVPTMNVFANDRAASSGVEDDRVRRFMRAGAAGQPGIVRAASEAGVTVLAGTDGPPHGNVATEIRHLADAGVSAHDAVGAGSWVARAFLGLPGLEEGAPADLVAYPRDPRSDLDVLRRPARVILRGAIVA